MKIKNNKTSGLIDLHTHTYFSDGELSPDELIELAIRKGISIISITDHDTLLGIKNISSKVYDTPNLKIIPGIELSSKINKGRLHILGYDIDINNKELNDKMEELQNNSLFSILALIVELKKDYEIIIKTEDIRNLVNANHNLGRPDLAKILIRYGLANSIQDAFDKYLIDAYNKTRSFSKGLIYEECFKLIKTAGGLSVLAHPKSLELDEKGLLSLLIKMKEKGLNGIEVYHSSHTREETLLYLKLAKELGLLISGGSDYHGSFIKPEVELGIDNNIADLSILKYIKK